MGVGFRLAPQGYVFTPVYLIALLWMLLSSMELMSIVDTSVTVVNVVVDTDTDVVSEFDVFELPCFETNV